jgi:hypothetical protein
LNTPVSISANSSYRPPNPSLFSHLRFPPDKYKAFQTKVHVRTLCPKFKEDKKFLYSTQYADRLYHKYLVVTVKDKDYIGKQFIGAAKVDLHTLLTGPQKQVLELTERGKPSGQITFFVQFEKINIVHVNFRKAQVVNVPNYHVTKQPNCYLLFSTDKKEHKLSIKTKEVEGCNPVFPRVECLRFNTHFKVQHDTHTRLPRRPPNPSTLVF